MGELLSVAALECVVRLGSARLAVSAAAAAAQQSTQHLRAASTSGLFESRPHDVDGREGANEGRGDAYEERGGYRARHTVRNVLIGKEWLVTALNN